MIHVTEYAPVTAAALDTIIEIEASLPNLTAEETRKRLTSEAKYSGAWTLIGTVDDANIGFAFGYPAIFEKERDGAANRDTTEYLSSLVVLPSLQGMGYGTELLHNVERHAAQLGRSSLALFTAERNAGARKLYLREGWDEEQVTEHQLPNGKLYNIVHYSKQLST